jgi:hypothetical protein
MSKTARMLKLTQLLLPETITTIVLNKCGM